MARASFFRRTLKSMFRSTNWLSAVARYKEQFPTIFRAGKWHPLAEGSLWSTLFGMRSSPLNLVGKSRRGRNSLQRMLRVENLEQKQLLAVNVAVVDTGDDASFAALAGQLANDTNFDFTVSLVSPTAVDTVGELNAFDVVVIGNDGGSTAEGLDTFSAALNDWVQDNGGGVVTVGFGLYGIRGGAEQADLDAIIPVAIALSDYNDQGVGSALTLSGAHPVTAGVTSPIIVTDPVPGAPSNFAEGIDASKLDAWGTALGTYGDGKLGVVAGTVPTGSAPGRSVYLGPIYAGGGAYDTSDWRVGEPDQLLENAVNWAANVPVGPFATVWVDNDWVEVVNGGGTPGIVDNGDTVSSDPDDGDSTVTNKTFGSDAFATIQAGIGGVTVGGTVNVNAGDYFEHVVVDKDITLLGRQAGVDARTRSATPESIVDGTFTSAPFQFLADGITLDGFYVTNGQTTLESGIHIGPGNSGYSVTNNIITNNQIGIFASSDGASSITQNLIFANNLPGAAGGAGIYTESTVNLTIDSNEITGHTVNNPVIFASTVATGHTGLVFTRNLVHSNDFGVFAISLTDALFQQNDISTAGNATGLIIGDRSTDVDILNNTLDDNFIGFRTEDFGFFGAIGTNPTSDVVARFNSLVPAPGPGNLSIRSVAGSHTGILDASANYYGVSDPLVVAGMIDDPDANVDFTPILNNGDANPGLIGFQPDLSEITVHDQGAQFGGGGRIAEGNALVAPGGQVNVDGFVYEPFVANPGSTVSPGSSPGIMVVTSFTVNATNTVLIEIEGAGGPGDPAGHDQIIVDGLPAGAGGDGGVTLGGATLDLDGAGLPGTGTITIIDNDNSADPVSGTFAGLPEGATIAHAGGVYRISYVGGDGNDVTLTKLFGPPLGVSGVYEFESLNTSANENAPPVGTFPAITVFGDFSLVTDPAMRRVDLDAILGSATLGTDYTIADFIIPQANFAAPTTFNLTTFTNVENPTPSVTINGDTTVEADEFFRLQASDISTAIDAGDADGLSGVESTVDHTIVNDDKATAVIAASDPIAAEVLAPGAPNPGLFTVSLTALSSTDTTVNYTVAAGAGQGTPGADYVPLSGSVTILANTPSATIPVDVLDDLLLEGTETVTVTLTGTSNPSVGFSATPATVNILDDEASTASVAASDATGSEPGADDGTFTFSLTQTSATDTKITYSIGGTATGGPAADYKALSGTVTILAGLKTADVLVDVLDDAFLEGTETVTVAITAVDNPAIGFSATPATVSILDNETGSIAVTVAGGDDAAEPADDGLFTFTLTGGPAPTDTKVNFTVAGSATPTPGANADYTSIGTSVTIPAGKSSATVLVDVIDDLLVESTETVIVTLTGTDNPAISAAGTATVNIADNDKATVNVTQSDPSAAEVLAPGAPNPGEFTFMLTGGPSGSDTTITFTMTGTATETLDYKPIGKTVVIPAGKTSATVTIDVVDDPLLESQETVILTIDKTDNPNITPDLAKISATVTIDDNDKATVSVIASDADASEPGPLPNNGAFTVTLSSQSASPTTVFYNVAGTATNGTDYTFLTGSVTIGPNTSSAVIPVTVTEDLLIEGTENVVLTLTGTSNPNITVSGPSATVNIADNDGATVTVSASDPTAAEVLAPGAPNPGQFTVSLSTQSATPTTVNYTISGNAINGTDYGPIASSVVIPANTSFVNIPINVIDDGLVEGNELVTITLNSTSGTPDVVVDLTPATVTIVDNEASTVSIAATDPLAAEVLAPAAPNPGEFTVTLSQQSATATTVFYTVSGSAINGTDYALLSGSLVIPANTSSGTIPVNVTDDLLVEGVEAVSVTLTSTSNGSILVGAPSSATVNIADNDVGTVSIVATDPNASEVLAPGGPNPGLFTITLTQQSPTATTVFYTVGGTAMNGVDYQPLTGAVVIPANTPSMGLPVDVIDDLLLEGAETVIVTLTSTNNPGITVGGPNSATVTIADNEINIPPVVTTNTGSTVAEGGTDIITAAELNTTDADTPAANLTYAVTVLPVNGTVRRSGVALGVGGTFTQADINGGIVDYVHNGSETTSDSFGFSISDGTTTLGGNTFNITVTPVNDPPIVVAPVADVTVAEESAPTVINVSGVFADSDPGDSLKISVLSSNAAVANASLSPDGKTLTLTYSPNQAGMATITLTATDTKGASVSDVFLANVTNVNDPITANDDNFSTPENKSLTANVLTNDTDPDNLDSDPANDTLSAALLSVPASGILVFQSNGTFTYTPDNNFNGTVTFTYRAFDNKGSFDDAKVSINVQNVNQPPVAGDDKFSTLRNTALSANVLVNDSDPDSGDFLFTSLQTPAANGLVVLQSNGNFTYTPNANFVGTDTFQYLLSDGQGGTDIANVEIKVTAPVGLDAADDFFSQAEDTVVTGNLLANDVDPENDAPFQLISTTAPSSGTLVFTDFAKGLFTYTPFQNFFGTDTFSYTIQDTKGLTDTAKVTLSFSPVNDIDALNDTFTVEEGKTLNQAAPGVLGNDLDPEQFTGPDAHKSPVQGVIAAAGDSDPTGGFTGATSKGGTVTVQTNGSFVYNPPAVDFFGQDTFTYTIIDGLGATDSATVTINVGGTNDAPDAVNDPVNGATGNNTNRIFVPEDSANNFIDVLANDTDPDNDKLVVSAVSPPSNGVVEIVPGFDDPDAGEGGGVRYTPNLNYFGPDQFTYTVRDPSGKTDTATVFVFVTDQPDTPSPVDDTFSATEDAPPNGFIVIPESDMLKNDFNPNVPPIDIIALDDAKFHVGGKAELLGDGSVRFTPTANFNGNASFNYFISGAAANDPGKVTINFLPVNDPPTVNTDTFATPVNTAITVTTGQLLANDSDVEGGMLVVVGVSNPVNGTVVFNTGTGQITFTPNNNFNGAGSFNYTVSDSQGAFATGLVVIQVQVPNSPPTAVDDFRTVQEIGPDGSNHNRSTRIEFPRTDLINGIGSPVVGRDTDPDNDALSFVELVAGSAIGGTVSLVGNNSETVRFDTAVNFVGDASFEYKMTDGRGGFDIGKQTITVTDRNDPPDAVNDSASTPEDTKVTINVLVNDLDADKANPSGAKFGEREAINGPPEELRVISVGTAANGQAAIGPGGVIFYTPNQDFVGNDSFSYTIADLGQDNIAGTGDDLTDTATVTVAVGGAQDVNAINDSFKVNEDTIRAPLDVLSNDFDPDIPPQAFKVTSVTQGSKGVVEVGPDGKNVLYTPDPNFTGFDQFTYTITDTENSTDTATVTVEVLNQGEPPLAKNDAQTVLEDSPPNVIPVLANDSDPDGNNADMRVVAVTQGANGVVAIRAGQLDVTYQPNPNFFGTDTFTYSVRDSANNVSTASVVVTVTGIPDAPDAKNDLATVNEGTTKNTIDVLANDVDPDGDAITVSAVTQGQSGTVAIAADSKSVLYTPNAGFVGSDVFTYTIRDPAGNTDSATVLVTVNDLIGPDFIGTDKDDVFLVRLDPTGKNIQVFNNATGTGTPVFSAPLLTSAPLSFDLKLGNDRLIVDSTNGNPIPTGGISYIGGANDIAGDRLSVMGNGALTGSYAASGATSSNGLVTVGGRQIALAGVEPIDVNNLLSFTIVTPNPNDTLALSNVVLGTDRIAGTSGAITLSDVSLTNVASTIIDTAANDGGAGNDSLTITASGPVPSSLGSLTYLSGTGTNTLSASGAGRITSMTATASGNGTLDVTVGPGHQMISPEFRYRSLNLGAGSRYQVSPSVAGNVISVVDTLTLAGATNAWTSQLDLRTSDLEVQSTAGTKAVDVATLYNQLRQGFNGGTWTGQGITSSTAATNPNADTGLNMGDNALLGYSVFTGEPVNANSVLFKYTYYGDIDMNGRVDADDLTVFGNNFGRTSGAVQTDGDIDFNNRVDADDLTVFGNNFRKGTPGNPNPPLNAGGPMGLSAAGDSVDADMLAAVAESMSSGQKKDLKGSIDDVMAELFG